MTKILPVRARENSKMNSGKMFPRVETGKETFLSYIMVFRKQYNTLIKDAYAAPKTGDANLQKPC